MFVLKFAILAIAAIWIARSLDIERFLELAAAAPGYLFIAGSAIVLLQAALMAARWKRITGFFADTELTFGTSYTAILISFFFSQGLPASIGGDAVRIWLLKERGATVRAGIKAILVDRFWGLLSLVFVASCGLLALTATQQQLTAWHGVMAAAAVLSVGLVLATVSWPPALLVWSEGFARRYLPFTASTVGSLVRLKRNFDAFNRRPGRFGITFLESVAVHILMLAVAALPFTVEPQSISMFAFFAAIPPALLVSYLPISIAGWGVREGALIVSLGLIGIPLEEALLISLFIGLTVLLVSLLGGVFWIVSDARHTVRPTFANDKPDRAPHQ